MAPSNVDGAIFISITNRAFGTLSTSPIILTQNFILGIYRPCLWQE